MLVHEHGFEVEDSPRVPGLVPRAVVLGGGRVVGADLVDVAVVDALEALLPVAEAVVAPTKNSVRVARTAKDASVYLARSCFDSLSISLTSSWCEIAAAAELPAALLLLAAPLLPPLAVAMACAAALVACWASMDSWQVRGWTKCFTNTVSWLKAIWN